MLTPDHRAQIAALCRDDAAAAEMQTLLETLLREQADRLGPSLFEQMFQHNTTVQLLIDPSTGKIVDANPTARAFYGYPNLVDMPIWEINTVGRDGAVGIMSRTRQSNIYFGPYQHRLASGELREVDIHAGPITRDGQRLLLAIVIDVSERAKVEAALRERERECRTLAHNIPDPLARFDRDNRLLYGNPALGTIGGLQTADIIGKRIDEIITDPSIAEKMIGIVQQVFSTSQEVLVELPFHNRFAQGILQARFVPEFDDAGQVVAVLGISRDITELKQTQQAHTESEQRLRLIADNIGDIVIFADTANRISYVNPAVEQITGYWVGDMLGTTLSRWIKEIHPEDLALVSESIRQQSTLVPFRFRHAEGHYVWLDARMTPISDDTGAFGGVVVVYRDVSDRKTTEDALEESREMFKAFTDTLPGAAFIKDEQGQYQYVNRFVREQMSRIEWVGHRPEDVFGETQGAIFREVDRLALAEGYVEGQHWLPDANGQMRCFHTHSFAIPRRGKPAVVGGLDLDITDLMTVEEQLGIEQERLDLVLQSTLDGVWDWDIANDHIHFSDSLLTLVGYTQAEFEDGLASLTALVHPDDRAAMEAAFNAHFAGTTPDYQAEYRVRHKAGHWVWLWERGRVVKRGPDGTPERMVGIDTDISARRHAEAELRANEARLRLVLEQLPATIWTTDADLRLDSIAGAAIRILHLPVEQFIGTSVLELAQYGLNPHQFENYQRTLQGESVSWDTQFRGRNFRVHVEPLHNHAGDIIGSVGVALDISEHEHANEQLRLSEQRFRLLAEYASDIISMSNPDGTLVYLSPSAKTITGFEPNEMIGTNSSDRIHPDDLPEVHRFRTSLMDAHGSHTARHEYRYLTRSGDYIWLETYSQPILDSDGKPIQVVSASRNITERRKMEEALRLSEDRYQRAAQASHVGVWEWNLETFEMYIAPNLKGMLGYGDDEIENTMLAWRQHIHPDDFDDMMERSAAHVGGLTPFYTSEHRMITKTGDVRWFLTRGQVIFDANDRPVRVVGTDTDITELKRIQHALEARDATLRAISATAQNFLRQRNWRDSIRTVLASLGQAAVVSRVYLFEVLNQTESDTQVIQRYEWCAAGIKSAIGKPPTAQWLRKIGFDRWVDTLGAGRQLASHIAELSEAERIFLKEMNIHSIAATPIFVGQRWWGFIGYDVCYNGYQWTPVQMESLQIAADTLAAAIEREASEQALTESEAKFRQLAANIPEMFWLEDAVSGAILYASPAAQTLVGGAPQNIYDNVHPDDAIALERERQRDPAAMNIEYRLVAEDGARRWVLVRTFPIVDEGGALYRIAGIARDITERKAVERSTMELALERERTDILTRFIRDASHEFRTPLSIISTNLSLLRHGPSGEVHEREYDKIQRNADLILELVEGLVEMVVIESTTSLTVSTLNLNNLARQLLDAFQRELRDGAYEVVIDLDPSLPQILGNLNRLYEAIGKILDNAVRYTPKGGSLTLRSYQDGYMAVLEISDTGQGIGPHALPHVFDRFYREDVAHTTHGFGLGLSIAKRIVELHYGTIEVTSERGVGSTFRVQIPVVGSGGREG